MSKRKLSDITGKNEVPFAAKSILDKIKAAQDDGDSKKKKKDSEDHDDGDGDDKVVDDDDKDAGNGNTKDKKKEDQGKDKKDKKDKKEPEKDSGEDDDGGDDEIDLLAFDPESFRTKAGKKPSSETKSVFNKFKESLAASKKEIEELKTKLSSSSPDASRLEELEKENKKLQEKFEKEKFLSSPAFERKFEAPLTSEMESLGTTVKEAMEAGLMDEEERKSLQSAISRIQGGVLGNKMAYSASLKLIDEAVESQAVAGEIKNHLNEIRKLALAKQKAADDWTTSAKEAKQDDESRLEAAEKESVKFATRAYEEWIESNKKPAILLGILEKKGVIGTVDFSSETKAIKNIMKGKLSPEDVSALVTKAALSDRLLKVVETLDAAAAGYSKEVAELKTKLESLKKAEASEVDSDDDDEEDGDEDTRKGQGRFFMGKKSGYSLAAAIKGVSAQ